MRPRRHLVGRKITCSLCGQKTVKGTARVCKKVVFQFCAGCWTKYRPECDGFMNRVTAGEPVEKAKAA